MKNVSKRIVSLLLALTVAASMMVSMSAGVFAAEGADAPAESKGIHVVVNGGEYDLGYLSDEWFEKNTGDAAVYPFASKKKLGKVQYKIGAGVTFDKFFEEIGIDPEDLGSAVIHFGQNGSMEQGNKEPLPVKNIKYAVFVKQGAYDKEKGDTRVLVEKNGEPVKVQPILVTKYVEKAYATYDEAEKAMANAKYKKQTSCFIGNLNGVGYEGLDEEGYVTPTTDCNAKHAINGYDTINIVYNDQIKPVITSVKNTAKKTAKVTWKKVDGAKSYKLYRATKKSGKYTLVKKNITKTSYVNKSLKKGKTYYYKVTAVNAFNKDCKTSAVKSVKIKK